MAHIRYLEEADFYSDSDREEDFSQFLSDTEDENINEASIHLKKAEVVNHPFDIEIPQNSHLNDNGISLLDSLLGEVLSGEEVNPPVDGFFDKFDLFEEEVDVIDSNRIDHDDSGFCSQASHSASIETQSSENTRNFFENLPIEKYLQFMKEEEHSVSIYDIPDFASKKNVYGTSFNVRTGNIFRPPRFEFARRDDGWIDSCKAMTYDKEKSLNELLTVGRAVPTVKQGIKINYETVKFTDVHFRSAKEMVEMETLDIQHIIREAFNSRRLAVLLFGVEKNGTVTGCQLNPCKQDNLRLALDTAIQTEFVPPIENILDAIDVQFVPIEGLEGKFLIVIRVKQLRSQTYHLQSSM